MRLVIPTRSSSSEPSDPPPAHSEGRRIGAVKLWLFCGALSIVFAGLCNLVLQFIQSGGDGGYLWGFYLLERPGMFLLGTFVLWLLLVLLVAVLGRLWISVGLLFASAVLVGFVSYQKGLLRHEPVYPSDWAFADNVEFLTGMVSGFTLLMVGLSTVLVVSTFVLIGRVAGQRFPRMTRRTHPNLARTLVITRASMALACVLLLGYIGNFNQPGNSFRRVYDNAGAVWTGANQPRNYLINGFVGGFLYNMSVPAMERPAGYSQEEMARLTRKYATAASEINQDRTSGALQNVNVVLLLAEAFSDPLELDGLTLGEDPMPFTRELMMRTPSGNALVQKVGSGTANMEFEALTGMSLLPFNPQMDTPYQMLVQHEASFPSAVGLFNESGHDAVAIHPYNANMYQRNKVYPIMGFDRFVDKTKMAHHQTHEGNAYITDESAYAETLDVLGSTPEPLLINLVTMQNHYDYSGNYSDPVAVRGVDDDFQESIGQYARGLKYSDKALEEFVSSIDSLDEPTIVVFYGDHLPAGYPDEIYQQNSDRDMRQTPFFLYSNFFPTEHRNLPTTSPIHFMNHVFEMAGAKIPPYYALLAELEQEIPAMQHGIIINRDNEQVAEDELEPRAQEVLHDYKLVQYDLSVGKRYSQAEMFYPTTEPVSASDSGD